MGVFKMAWRNVWRNRRRTIVTVAAMSLALLSMIIYAGLIEGYLKGMERNVLDLEMGDIQVFAPDYRTDPSLHKRIEKPDALLGELDHAGYRASARLLGAGLAAAGDTSAGVMFYGIDIERDARVSEICEHVAEGAWLDRADPSAVVIGRRLARILGIGLDDEIVVLSQAADGSMANELYRVRGVLKTISDVVDRAGIFMLASTYRELMVVPDGAHQITVRHPEGVELDHAAATVSEIAGELDVKTWRQLMPTLASMIDSMRAISFVMYFITYVAIGIVILNAMLMAVFERIREFGVLKAIGTGPAGVLGLILTESAIQTALAVVVGGALSIPSLWYLTTKGIDLSGFGDMSLAGIAFDPVWRTVVNVHTFTGPVVMMVVVVMLAVLYPALKAAFIRPVTAMRHQ
jgi:ABC-type lipoprotein release transport system permease subunit